MPLVTPNIQKSRDPLHAMLRKLDGNVKDTIIGEGLIMSYLNFGNELRQCNKINEYPDFRRCDYMERLLRENLEKNPGNRYDTERLESFLRVPEEDLHVKEEWRRVWEREYRYYSPEERSRMKNEEGHRFEDYEPHLNSYGVCDSPEQLVAMYDFARDPRKFFIAFTPMVRAEQPSEGGWRWHKWGPYLGTHNPEYEYLYDEEGIDVVYVFHIYELLDWSLI